MQQIWFKDPSILFAPDTWYQFVPMSSMDTTESLNAVVRFSVYFSALLFAATGITTYLLAIPAIMVASIVLFSLFPNGTRLESFVTKHSTPGNFTMPTAENPFMNPLLTEIQDNPNRHDAAPINRKDVKAEMYQNFQKTADLYMDTSDLFDQTQAMQQFYTLQSATIPNDQDGFLKFLAKGTDEPDYSSTFPSRGGKKGSETYVVAKGSRRDLASTTSKPTGTVPRTSTA